MMLTSLAWAGEANPPGTPIPHQPSLDITLVGTFDYIPSITSLPSNNSWPNPVTLGDELMQTSYTDASGKIYDLQINLTKAQVKVFHLGVLQGQGQLTQQDVAVFHNIGDHLDDIEAQGFIAGIVAAIVGAGLVIAYEIYAHKQECSRQHTIAMNDLVNEAMMCLRDGGENVVDQLPQPELCGAGGYGHCEM